ncbi:hypothetical protein NDU88_007842 [Pleurodeles waltl]|uniref:Uncharacterized protein n=1 Tax=Pleurodeles waltl TaxID=8319 RepID=A0AAV7N386_PLEWA|nr:hypothetical protein NDU88_007842 [Pleurodeles waltl]
MAQSVPQQRKNVTARSWERVKSPGSGSGWDATLVVVAASILRSSSLRSALLKAALAEAPDRLRQQGTCGGTALSKCADLVMVGHPSSRGVQCAHPSSPPLVPSAVDTASAGPRALTAVVGALQRGGQGEYREEKAMLPMGPQYSVCPLMMMPGSSPAPTAPMAAPGQIRQADTVEGRKFGSPPQAACSSSSARSWQGWGTAREPILRSACSVPG